jgi:hypothetical protein
MTICASDITAGMASIADERLSLCSHQAAAAVFNSTVGNCTSASLIALRQLT